MPLDEANTRSGSMNSVETRHVDERMVPCSGGNWRLPTAALPSATATFEANVKEETMQLYDFPAPTPRRVRMFLAEKGIDIPRVCVDLTQGEQFRPAFQALNPSCTVPVLLLDNGTVLSEVPAIWHYLEATFARPSLLGDSPEETAGILMWERRMEFDGYFAAAEAFRNSAPPSRAGPHRHTQTRSDRSRKPSAARPE